MRLRPFPGSALIALLTYTFTYAQEGPQVEIFSPQGTVKNVRQVRARFSVPIVPLGDPRAIVEPFDIQCPESGTQRWADGKNWIYDFDRNLPAGVRCEFKVKPGLQTLAGKEITGQKGFSFSTGGPAIQSSTPYQGSVTIDEEQVFILVLDAEATEASVLANVSFSVEGLHDRIGVRILSGEERQQILRARFRREPTMPLIAIQAKQGFPNNAKVSLIWGKGILSKSGVATENDQILPFQTRKPFMAEFHCQRENPQAACIPLASMAVNFSALVSWERAGQIVLKAPDGKQRKPEREEQATGPEYVRGVVFKAPFPQSTEFLVELPPGLTDDAGRKLVNADKFPLTVRTDEYPPLAKFPARFGILELKANPILPVTLRNIEPEVKARMLKISRDKGAASTLSDFLQELKGRIFKVAPAKSDEMALWLKRVARANREISVFGLLDRMKEVQGFSIPKPSGAKAFEVVGIPLKDPGFYVVEIESEILGASLLGKSKSSFVPTAVLVTNLSVHFKWGRESSLAWVTTLDEGLPVRNSTVTIIDCAGKLLATSVTDADGIARFGELPSLAGVARCSNDALDHGLFITAEAAGDATFAHSSWDDGIESWRFQLPSAHYQGPTIAHTIFDRSLVRAGETISMKHTIRKHITNGFAMVPEGNRPKAVSIEHLGSEQKYELPLQWDASGTAETTWMIPREAKLGVYQVMLLKEPSSKQASSPRYSSYTSGWISGQFRVQEFRVPLMRAAILPPSRPLVSASEAPLDLTVKYLAGGGAGHLAVKLRSQLQPKSLTTFDGFEDFVFANGPVKEGRRRLGTEVESFEEHEEGESPQPAEAKEALKIQSTDLTLDKTGGARTTIAKLPKVKAPMDLLTELEYKDPNGEIQTVATRIPLWPAKWLVGIKPDSWALSQESLKFHVAVVNLSGAPVAQAPVKVELFERRVYSHRKRLVGGFYAYEHFEEVKKRGALCEGRSDKKGLLICESKSPISGNIILQAGTTDDAHNESVAYRDVWVAGQGEWWFAVGDHDRMDLLPEKKHYEPGETARFQVRMPFREATALVTVEREGITEAWVKKISGKKPVVEVPIKGYYAPNVYVSVMAVRGRVGGIQPTATVDLGRPAYKLGIAEVQVRWKAHELKVSVTTDRKVYKVREKAKVKIAAKTADGRTPPPGSEVAVVAVDEGLLELMPNPSWQLLQGMMGRRGYEVHTATAQMHVIGKRHFGLKALPQGGGGGSQITRELFDTLLLWKGRLPLDKNGTASLEVPLNDSLTSFRIVAIATGGVDFFGTGFTTIRSTQELMLLSGTPPLVREEDRFKSEFTLRNTTNRRMEVKVSGRLDRLTHPLKPQTVLLSPGGAKEIGWEIKVPVGIDSLGYTVEAIETGGNVDRIKISQKVVPAVSVRTLQATLAQVEKELRITVESPQDAIPGRGGIQVLLRPTLSDGLAGVIEYMKSYPYTCLEQRVSRAVALRDERLWRQVLAALPSHLDSDGLAKYFPSMTRGSDVLTSYIIAIAHEAGWKIPEEIKERMDSGLRRFVEGSIRIYSSLPTADLSIRKLAALEALSRSAKADPKLLSSIAIEPSLWPTSAVIDWFDLLQRSPKIPNRQARMREAEQILRSRLNFQGTTMGFSTEGSDFLWWLMVSNDTNAVRLILSMLSAEKWGEDMPRLVRGALGRQRRGAWDLTVANAWGVLAVEKFSKAFENVPVSGASTATLSAKSQSVEWNAAPKGGTLTFPWPTKRAEMVLLHAGSGKPWGTTQSLAAVPLKEALSSGYKIKKVWTPVEQKRPGQWGKGDLVRVTLELEAQADMTWVVVSDPIPAGASILGTGLGRDSALATRGEKRKGWTWPAFEERSFEAFRAYYEYVPKGQWTVEYTMRLNHSGEFHLPTTRVEALYSPEMFGEVPNKRVEVHP